MLILDNDKVKPIAHAKNTSWVESLKEVFGSEVQQVYNYIYFVHSKNSYVKDMLVHDRKEFVFGEHTKFKKIKNYRELEVADVFKDCVESYLKTMRTVTEALIYNYTCRIGELNDELMKQIDSTSIKDTLQIIEMFQKQITSLENRLFEENAEMIKPHGIAMFEIPDDEIVML